MGTRKSTSNQICYVSQQQLALVLNKRASWVRDNTWLSAFRGEDGRYFLPQCIDEWLRRQPTPESNLSDADAERALVHGEYMAMSIGRDAIQFAQFLFSIKTKHGLAGLGTVMRIVLEELNAATSIGPAADNEHKIRARHEAQLKSELESLTFGVFRPVVCGSCGKLRQGRLWVEARAFECTPLISECPTCDRQ